ncbi:MULTISPECIES: hypothetical protein [unclassified Streptomyces]|uniref:hypothetical protein n=1 Tax=unclassified Streptomyces TaxID=2593676 RepID=UPI002E191ACD|nr:MULTISPECIES: hypothetical protein [unclassified Streptomyces]
MTATRYRPRPTPIRALQWTGDNAAAMTAFAAERFAETDPEDRTDPDSTAALLESDHDSWFDLHIGDWVIRRAGGWFGVIDDTEFQDQYEPETDSEQPTTPPKTADRRERYAAAIRAAGIYDWRKLADAAIAVADQEQAELRRERDLAINEPTDEAQQAEPEPQPGDRVRVSYEGTWTPDDDPRMVTTGNNSGDVWRNIVPDHARVDVLHGKKQQP